MILSPAMSYFWRLVQLEYFPRHQNSQLGKKNMLLFSKIKAYASVLI